MAAKQRRSAKGSKVGSEVADAADPVTDERAGPLFSTELIGSGLAGLSIAYNASERPARSVLPGQSSSEAWRDFGFDSGAIAISGGRVAEGQAIYAPLPGKDPLVEAALSALSVRVPEIVHARQEALSQENIDLLVDAYLKSAPTAPARYQLEMDNARERVRFVEEFPCYTSREVAELAGHEAVNASATATRWKKARRIVGLPWKGSDLYPAFQFSEGRPLPAIAQVIEALPDRMSAWQVAFWLTSSNGWLGGATPLERLDDETAVLAAAAHESEALGG